MTLIVARVIGNQIKILSDTKITDPGSTKQGLNNHILKVLIVNSSLCVCYAQTISKALSAVRGLQLDSDASQNLDVIVSSLLEIHRSGDNDPDFIVASLMPQASLHKISNGELHSVPATYLGNQDAFSDYQERYDFSSKIKELPNNPSLYMDFAFRYLIDLGKYEDIGGYTIGVESGRDGFRYFQYSAGVNAIRLGANGVASSLATQTAGEGGYTYSILTPRRPGIGAIGIHFYQGNFGALLYPLKEDKPIVFNNTDMNEFKAKVLENYAIEISGPNVVNK